MERLFDQITLAVFPFENLSLQDDLGIFCNSFSADLITELSRFKQFRIIHVPASISRRQVISPDASEKLNTDYFIHGTFRCHKEMVRINVQLYNTPTHHLVWGDRLEGNLNDLAEIQETLLTKIIGVLQQQIRNDLLSTRKNRNKVDFKAYEHWLHGMEEIKKGSVENDLKAREHFEKALEVEPDYSLAHSGMSLSYFNEWSCQLYERWDASKSGAYEWAQKAIELDDQDYIAAMVLGKILLYDEAYETSEYYLRKSLRLNPNDPETVIQIAAYFVLLGLNKEAVELYQRTLRLDPVNSDNYASIGAFVLFEAGEFEEAAALSGFLTTTKWADAEAYCAAVFYYLQDHKKMNFYWGKFLKTYRRLIAKGNDFMQRQAIAWILEINPYKNSSNLEKFLEFISDEKIESSIPKAATSSKKNFEENYFLKEAGTWRLSFQDLVVQMPEVKGFYDIQKLLTQPKQLFHCAELMGSIVSEKGEKLFDAKAKKDYKKKILELQKRMHEANSTSNFLMLEKLQDEYDKVLEYLSESLGLNGKIRETGSTVEKARSAVTWRIRNAIAKIEQQHTMLGTHLSNAIKTGTFCTYQPDRTLTWLT